MARTKFGFKTFIVSKHPIKHPCRPFNFAKDLTLETKGLYYHLTPGGRVSRKTSGDIVEVLFCYYVHRKTAIVAMCKSSNKVVTIPLECLHRKVEEAA